MEKVLVGDCIDSLKRMDDQSVNCIVTSPPYYGLRDYGTGEWVGGDPNCPHRRTSKCSEKTITVHAQEELKGNVGDAIYKTICPLCGAVRIDKQIGLEETPEEYINRLVNVFRECRRVLKDDGTLWLNIGDSYCGTGDKGDYKDPKYADGRNGQTVSMNRIVFGCKQKDMIGIPWMLAFALRNDGWYLRQDIIWHKPNPMPESVKDRCVKSHEYIFLLSKKPKYYFDYEAIQEEAKSESLKRYKYVFNQGKQQESFRPDGATNTMGLKTPHFKHKNLQEKGQQNHSMHERRAEGLPDEEYLVRNKRDVWSVTTQAVKEAHFATFPEKLIEPCILAGCPIGGVVLDPFCGSGTTGIVSVRNQRNFIGCELNPEYAEMSVRRINKEKEQGIQMSLLT